MRLPASLQSLLIQIAALLCALLSIRLLQAFFPFQPALWQIALAQGGLAGLLSLAWRQPFWWLPLHAGFLPAVLLASRFGVPAWAYLAGFVLLGLFFWSTFRTRVPLYLSDRKAWDAVAGLLPGDRPFRFIDLGSGLGGLLFDLERRFPQGRFEGVELAPAPWLISSQRARLRGSRVQFLRRDYATLDLAEFDVVFAFLSPAAMPALWQQACGQMRRGSLFISLSFDGVQARPADQTVTLAAGARHRLYLWRM